MSTIPTYALYGEHEDDPGAGWVHCETIQARSRLHNYVIQPHRHERLFQILHLANGWAEIVVDGQHRRLEAPCIVALPPMVVHGYTFSPDVGGTVLTLFERRLAAILREAGDIAATFQAVRILPLAAHPDEAQALATDIAGVAAEFAGSAPGRITAIEARLALVLVALHRLEGSQRPEAYEGSARALHHLMRFRELVERDFRSHRSIEDYARRLGLTATHLNRICREHLGDTALGIVHRRIVLEAKRHLTFTSMSAKEIALALAFDDPSYFTRFFKRETGLSPTAFRSLQK